MLYNESVPAHTAVAERVEALLSGGSHRLQRIGVARAREGISFADPGEPTDRYAVAVGLEAASYAIAELGLRTVFCQVFNYQPLFNDGAQAWGVTSIPPLELQLQAWKRLDPMLSRIGMIVGDEHDDLVREARIAAEAQGLTLRHERSSSDRETLFHFRRLAREVDGFWLFPDNRILSPGVITEVLNLAAAQDIRVTAFNAASLPPGVFMNASASPEDVAQTVGAVIARLIQGDAEDLPAITPLSAVRVNVESDAAAREGTEPAAPFAPD